MRNIKNIEPNTLLGKNIWKKRMTECQHLLTNTHLWKDQRAWTPQGNLQKPLSYFDAINTFPKNCM